MKYVLAGLAAFVLAAGTTALIRAGVGAPAGPPAGPAVTSDRHAARAAPAEVEHGDHDAPAAPASHGQAATDLRNRLDPVTGAALGEDHSAHAHTVYQGFLVHLADDTSVRRFTRDPIRYLAPLGLEMTTGGAVLKVDPAGFKDPPLIPATCPMMGGDIDPQGDVFILHRGWRIYFCCWGGCATDFLADPRPHYATYGLREDNGALVAKE